MKGSCSSCPYLNNHNFRTRSNNLSKKKKTLNTSELETFSNPNSSTNQYLPWTLGIGGMLVIGIVAWTIRKKTKKKINNLQQFCKLLLA